jgi:hypothetical protein
MQPRVVCPDGKLNLLPHCAAEPCLRRGRTCLARSINAGLWRTDVPVACKLSCHPYAWNRGNRRLRSGSEQIALAIPLTKRSSLLPLPSWHRCGVNQSVRIPLRCPTELAAAGNVVPFSQPATDIADHALTECGFIPSNVNDAARGKGAIVTFVFVKASAIF